MARLNLWLKQILCRCKFPYSMLVTNSIEIHMLGRERHKFLLHWHIDGPSNHACHTVITVQHGVVPAIEQSRWQHIFQCDQLWNLYRTGRREILVMQSPANPTTPLAIATFKPYRERVELIVNESERAEGIIDNRKSPEEMVDPLHLVLKFVLMNWATRSQAMLLHACAVLDGTDSYVFAGHHTDGKSTISRVWMDDGKVLGDEIILLGKDNGDYYVHGLLPHCHDTVTSLQRMKVNKIFFIRHSPSNQIARVGVAGATSALLTRCFAPRWDKRGMETTIDLAGHVAKDVPCYNLGFVPDRSIVSFLRTYSEVDA